MKTKLGLLIGAMALAFFLPLTLVSVQGAPDGLPVLSGDWAGTAKSKIYDTSTDGEREKEKIGIEVSFVQTGSELEATVTVPDDPESTPFELTGTIGNGHFWLSGEEEEGDRIVMVGHVKSSGKKIKGIGLSTADEGSEVTEFTFKLKPVD